MKKKTLTFALVLVAVIGGALYYLLTNLDAIVKSAIEKYGSQTTQTAVRVDKVRITLADGAGVISGLSIANPKGFGAKNAFTLGAIETQIDLKSLTKGPVTINKVIVRNPQIFYELNKSGQANLDVLQRNIATSAGNAGASKRTAKSEEPKLIIRRFQLTGATVEANIVPLKSTYTLKLPPIELQNLGGKNGATPSEISRQVLDIITQRAIAAVRQAGIDNNVRAVTSETKKIGTKAKDTLKKVFGK